MIRLILVAVGLISLAFGAVGLFLPLLPTVPFVLLSALCFANTSERLHGWLVSHRIFGPQIVSWTERGAIGRTAKWAASASIVGSFLLAILLGFGQLVLTVQAVCLLGVALFIWSRPDA